MTAPNLKNNFKSFGSYFAYKLRSLRTLTVLNSIFALLSYPAVMLALLPFVDTNMKMNEFRDKFDEYWVMSEYLRLQEFNDLYSALTAAALVICAVMLVAMFIMSYIIPSKSFRWLHDKTVVDMDYALPVSDDTRFFGDLLASVTGSLLPHALAVGAGAGLFRLLPFDEVDPAELNTMYNLLVKLSVTGFVSCVMFMGTTLLVMSLCARSLEARLMPFVVNGLITVVHYVCVLLMTRGMTGYRSGSTYEFAGTAVTSPLGLLLNTLLNVENISDDNAENAAILFRPWIFVSVIIITLLYFTGAYFIIRRRRAERVGSPYAFSVMKYIIPSAVMFALVLLAALLVLPDDGNFRSIDYVEAFGVCVVLLIVSFIVYIIMELISGNGFKRFHRTFGRYALTMAISAVVCLGIYSLGGAVFARVTPAADNVVEIDVSIHLGMDENSFQGGSFETSDRETIENIIEVHEALAKKNMKQFTSNFLIVDYYLENGSVMRREFYMTDAQAVYAREKLFTSGSYYDYAFGRLDDMIEYSERFDEVNIIERIVANNSWTEVNIPLEELQKAFREDCETVTTEKLLDDDNSMRIKLIIGNYSKAEGQMWRNYTNTYNFVLQPWCENTIALINKYMGEDIFAPQNTESWFVLYKVPVTDFLKDGQMQIEYLYMDDGYEMGYSVYGDDTVRPLERGWDYIMPIEGDDYLFDLSFVERIDESYGTEYGEEFFVYFLVPFKNIDKDGMNKVSFEESAMIIREGWQYHAEEYFLQGR